MLPRQKNTIRITPAALLLWLTIMAAPVRGQFNKSNSASEAQTRLKAYIPDSQRLNILYDLCYYYIAKPGENTVDLDSALDILKQANPTVRILNDPASWGKYYLLQSKALRERGDANNGKANLEKALHYFSTAHLYELGGDATRDLNQYYPANTNEEVAAKVPILRRMIALYDSAGAKKKQAEGLTMLGDLYTVIDADTLAIPVLEMAIALHRSIHSEELQVPYELLCSVYHGIGNQQKAIQYGLLAIQTARQVHDTGMIVSFYNRLAIAFFSANRFPEAVTYFTLSIRAAQNLGYKSDIILVGSNLADAYNSMGKPLAALKELEWVEKNYGHGAYLNEANLYGTKATALIDLGRYAEAWTYINKLIPIEIQTGNKYGRYRLMVKYYLATKDFKKVAAYADSQEIAIRVTKIGINAPLVHLWRFKADSATGRLIPAIWEYQRYKQMADSILNDKTQKEISRLNVLYETDQKDNAIKSNQLEILALQKEDGLKTAEIRSTRFNRNVTIAGTILLLILLALVYNQYRIKQRSNRTLLVKQTEINAQNEKLQGLLADKEWLMKEIHHRVKNNLQLIMSLLNTQSDTSENADSFSAVNEIRQRIFSMSLVHQRLYQTDQVSVADMYTYVPELVDFLKDSFTNSDRVRFELHIDSIELDANQAISIGLILNELLTNSFKHAFGAVARGLIRIDMLLGEEDMVCLAVRDNGRGIPSEFESRNDATMGMHLIKTLVQQLCGTVSFTNDNGLLAKVNFKRKMIPDQKN